MRFPVENRPVVRDERGFRSDYLLHNARIQADS